MHSSFILYNGVLLLTRHGTSVKKVDIHLLIVAFGLQSMELIKHYVHRGAHINEMSPPAVLHGIVVWFGHTSQIFKGWGGIFSFSIIITT